MASLTSSSTSSMPSSAACLRGLCGPQVQVTEHRFPGTMQGKSKDVGRIVVAKVVEVESSYGCIVEEGQGDLSLFDTFSPQRVAHRGLQHRGGDAEESVPGRSRRPPCPFPLGLG